MIKTSGLCPKELNLDFCPHKTPSAGAAVLVEPSEEGEEWDIGMGEDACELPVTAR